jgi:putative OPT family oligopeptide transporter
MATSVWRFIVRPIAVGGMLVGAGFTMFRMREKIGQGLARAVRELSAGESAAAKSVRTERYMASKTVFLLIGLTFIAMAALYISFAGTKAGLTAAIVMLIAGFFFCVVSGYLVGMIGSTNNPISGITLSTLIVAALLMVALGVSGQSGVIAVLGVAAVVCVAAAVAGELLQDFKVGYILGGTRARSSSSSWSRSSWPPSSCTSRSSSSTRRTSPPAARGSATRGSRRRRRA